MVDVLDQHGDRAGQVGVVKGKGIGIVINWKLDQITRNFKQNISKIKKK